MALNEGDVQPLVVGVVSHRNLVPAEIDAIRLRVRELLGGLQRDHPQLPLVVVSALADGGDQLVAEEALALGARLVAPLPFARGDYARDFAAGEPRARFERLCEQATVLEPTLEALRPHGAGAPARTPAWHYARAGVFIASHCHLLLALWDGKPSDLPGGTAQIVAYYRGGKLPRLIERRHANARANPLDEDGGHLLCHLVCSRDAADGVPRAPLAPLQFIWHAGEETGVGVHAMPTAGRAMCRRIAAFNLDHARHVRAIDAHARSLRGQLRATPTPPSPIERSFAIADWLALHYQRRVLLSMRAMYTLAALMGIAFVLYGDWSQQYMIFVFLLLFALGVALDRVATRREWHRKYLDYRALAEGLRVQAYWHRAGLSITEDGEFAHDDFLQKQDVSLGWIRNVMRSMGLAAAQGAPPVGGLEAVIDEWVGRAGDGGQLHYYEGRFAERLHHHRLTQRIGAISLWASIAISVFLAVFVFTLPDAAQTVLVSLMATLSIIAAVREAYAYRKADKELIKQYRFMLHIFSRARQALDATNVASEQREILRALGEAALTEHAEWTLMHRERPLDRARM